jgi:hypothetical protein
MPCAPGWNHFLEKAVANPKNIPSTMTLDETAANLPATLANAYHDIKRRGTL